MNIKDQNIQEIGIKIPESYPYKYTIHYLIMKKSIEEGKGVNEIALELANKLCKNIRTIQRYKSALRGSSTNNIEEKLLDKISKYFKVEKFTLFTENLV